MPWNGDLMPQFSNIDLNRDGITAGSVLTGRVISHGHTFLTTSGRGS
jgi:hypothetical protein